MRFRSSYDALKRRLRGVTTSLVALLGFALPGVAQPADLALERIDGRTFQGLELPENVLPGGARFRADKAYAWDEGTTRRLLLSGDTVISVGIHTFRARRAVVWMEPTIINGAQAHKLAIYFDDVFDPGSDAGVGLSADRILITGVITGGRTLATDSLDLGRPDTPFLTQAERRLAQHLTTIAGEGRTRVDPFSGAIVETSPALTLAPAEQGEIIVPRRGVLSLAAPTRALVRGDGEDAVVLTDGVILQYNEIDSGQTLQITAQSAVAFLKPDADSADPFNLAASDLTGVYFEKDVVATNGRYTLRGPRMHYDLATDRAVVLDAVFWTYDEQRGLPLYVRADAIRQTSSKEWTAHNARVANSAFFEPQFSLGATEVTIRRDQRADGSSMLTADAKAVQFRSGGAPLVSLPRQRGEIRSGPLREVRFETEDGDPIVRTRWDAASLLGMDLPPWLDAELLLDAYIDRGPGVGADLSWSKPNARGGVTANTVFDNGTDILPSGDRIKHDNDWRGLVLADHQQDLGDGWRLAAELAWISDPTYLDAFRDNIARTHREFTNAIALSKAQNNSLLLIEARAPLTDFAPNHDLLQSQGFQLQKLPELSHALVNQDLLSGFLKLDSEITLTSMSLRFTEESARNLGFKRTEEALAALGIAPNQSPADRLRAAGYDEDTVNRFDIREEISAPLSFGALNVTPFLVGRFTAYDTDFSNFRATGNDDQHRLWGAAGLRLATTLMHVDEFAESRLFDIHRLRHVVEPSATFWASDTSLNRDELPLYEHDVEGINSGKAYRLGLRNTWQTQRGGPGHWRSVDWLTLNTDFVQSKDHDLFTEPVGRWYETRPENSNLGKYIAADLVMQLTGAVAVTGSAVYDLDDDVFSTSAVGVVLDHGFGFSSFGEVRTVDFLDSTLLHAGAVYELTKVYALEGRLVYDLDRTELDRIGATIQRRFPQWTLDIGADYDDIRQSTSLSFRVQPVGVGGEDRARVLRRDLSITGERLAPDLPARRSLN
ncbi:MAG: LPS assembly protein LptD [Phycisphaeraceae bacterium]|nr:LPS assembly protein LptD [Phycisphaeraceae bacterium]